MKRTSNSELDELLEGRSNERCVECGGIYGLNQASWCPGAPECEAAVRAEAAFPDEALLADESEVDDDDESDDLDVTSEDLDEAAEA